MLIFQNPIPSTIFHIEIGVFKMPFTPKTIITEKILPQKDIKNENNYLRPKNIYNDKLIIEYPNEKNVNIYHSDTSLRAIYLRAAQKAKIEAEALKAEALKAEAEALKAKAEAEARQRSHAQRSHRDSYSTAPHATHFSHSASSHYEGYSTVSAGWVNDKTGKFTNMYNPPVRSDEPSGCVLM
jgi:hypothetical protein